MYVPKAKMLSWVNNMASCGQRMVPNTTKTKQLNNQKDVMNNYATVSFTHFME
jgi:hypothetical protein